MIKAVAGDKDLVVSLLEQAGDGLSDYQFKNKKQRDLLLSQLFDLYFNMGEIWLSGNRRACALIMQPGISALRAKAIPILFKLIFSETGRAVLSEAWHHVSRGGRLKSIYKITYIRWICVDPLFQRRGTGSGLLGRILEKAAAKNRIVYAQTATLKNLDWLEKFGFEGYDVLDDQGLKNVTFLLKRSFSQQALTNLNHNKKP
ncbi:GNAT family N-acetyltransferase [Mucilaginibacter flavus]|uniref:GNAT family N-acetyltransferase n=1 Tax=Mucilaginibacter flavus TaxID=931504 RepID=UPI0025B284EF|nr:GNAT family N-acetyltransferase [Mucilaginibacter flavus]MDN3580726.1 GNAT family N-acetyltransferase [Mucilaginibacter flavus]